MTAIARYQWSQIGYRRCGPLPKNNSSLSAQRFADGMQKLLPYEKTDKTWIRRHGRKRGQTFQPCLRIVGTLTREVQNLDFVDAFGKSEFTGLAPVLNAEFDTLAKLVDAAPTKESVPLEIYSIAKALDLNQARAEPSWGVGDDGALWA